MSFPLSLTQFCQLRFLFCFAYKLCVSLPLSLSLFLKFFHFPHFYSLILYNIPPLLLHYYFYYYSPYLLVQVYSGGSCSKVVEYSGNTNGFVSHSVLGKGWPKELVKVKCILGMSPVSISSPHTGMDTSSTELRSENKKPTD